MTTSEIERIIPPEIKNDEFYQLIMSLSATEKLDFVLEIGSSAGGGSTEAFVNGLARNSGKPTLFCIEVSTPRFRALRERYAPYPFVKCYNMSSIALSEFPQDREVVEFYRTQPSNLNNYPLDAVLGWLEADRQYVARANVPANAIDLIKQEHGITNDDLDLVLIDGSEFTGDLELAKVIGARIILLDDTNTYKCFKARQILLNHPEYELFADNQSLRNGYSAFRRRPKRDAHDLPVHFFTIVLNGEPWIRYHEEVLAKLPFNWHWHIVEGVASLAHDTAWSVAGGGRIDPNMHRDGRSNDGTSEYLDHLAARFPHNVTVYRKPPGVFWDGKREMVNAPLPNIKQECLLWQIDCDELWTEAQIQTVRDRFIAEPHRSAAFYWCWYFVGADKIVSTRHNYAQNPSFEWLRTWRFRPGDFWAAHEPPTLVRPHGTEAINIAAEHPFLHDETEAMGAVFQHYAYVMEEQAQFKESYYGYAGAVAAWRALQAQKGTGLLGEYLGWVKDYTMFDDADLLGVQPLALRDAATGKWHFQNQDVQKIPHRALVQPRFVLDGVCWQNGPKSVQNFWCQFLLTLVQNGMADQIVLLDRAGTAPRIKGVHTLTIRSYQPNQVAADSLLLEATCRSLNADLFVSTGTTIPTDTPSFRVNFGSSATELAHSEAIWAANHASAHAVFSAFDGIGICKAIPDVSSDDVLVLPLAASEDYQPLPNASISAIKQQAGLPETYVVLTGERLSEQSADTSRSLVQALHMMRQADIDISLVCVGGAGEFEAELRELAPSLNVFRIDAEHEAVPLVFAAAHALVYASSSNCIGAPVLNAMACGTPILAMPNTLAAELAQDVACLCDMQSPNEIAETLVQLHDVNLRATISKMSSEQAAQFTAQNQAEVLLGTLNNCVEQIASGARAKPGSGWRVLRTYQMGQQ